MDDVQIENISSDPDLREKHLDQVMAVEVAAWPAGTQATREKFELRSRIFPEGFFLAFADNRVVGVTTSQRFHFSQDKPLKTWEILTNRGRIEKAVHTDGETIGHHEDGVSLYVVSLGVHPDVRNQHVGSHLIKKQQELAAKKKLSHVVLGARLPGYAVAKAHDPALSADVYAHSTRPDGLPWDDEIRFYHRNGFRIYEVKPNNMDDDLESLNYGVVMVWKNPELN